MKKKLGAITDKVRLDYLLKRWRAYKKRGITRYSMEGFEFTRRQIDQRIRALAASR